MMSHLDEAAFTDSLTSLFHEADKDQSGSLDSMEFRECLRSSSLGLTDGDIGRMLLRGGSNRRRRPAHASTHRTSGPCIHSPHARPFLCGQT